MGRALLYLLISSACVFLAPRAFALVSPISLNVAPPLQFPPNDFTIGGARISILWGQQKSVYGLDVGLLGNISDQSFTGVAVSGLFNITHGTTTAVGLQLAGLINFNTKRTEVIGLQLAGAINNNTSETYITGLQAAVLANLSEHTYIYGVQASLYNRAYAIYGFQIGLVNFARNLHGIQIGLLNFNPAGLLAVSPIINVGF